MKMKLGSGMEIDTSPAVMLAIQTIIKQLTTVRKAEVDTDKYTIRAYRFDPGNGKQAVRIEIVEG